MEFSQKTKEELLQIIEELQNENQFLKESLKADNLENLNSQEIISNHKDFNETLLNTIPFGINIVDETGNTLYCNENFKVNYVNYAAGKKCWEILSDDACRCEVCPLKDGIEIGITKKRDTKIITQSKSIEVIFTGLMFNNQKALLELFIDISDRKLTEERLRESEEFVKSVIEGSNDCIKVLDIDGRLLSMNENGIKSLEIDDIEPYINTSWVDFWDKNEQKSAIAALNDARVKGRGVFFGFKKTFKETPKWWEVVVSPIKDEKGNPIKLVAVSRDVTHRRIIEQELHESLERFRILFEQAAVGVAQINTQSGKFVKINRKYSEIIGYSEEEILELDFQTITFPEDLQEDLDNMELLRKGLINEFNIIKRLIHKDGSIIWVELSVSPMWEKGSTPDYHIAVVADITKRKKIEESLKESEEKFRLISENTSDGIIILNSDHIIEYASPAYCKLFDCSEEEVIKKDKNSIFNAIHTEDREVIFANIFKAIDEKKSGLIYEYRFRINSGEYIWREDSASFIYDENKNYLKSYVVCRDISERKQQIDQLIKFTKAIEQSPASIVITDKNGTIEYVNPKFCEITGYDKNRVLGKNPKIVKSGKTPKEVYETLWNTILSGKEWRGEMINRKKNRELYWESVSISPICNADGEITHFIGVKEDISERKNAEEELNRLYDELKYSNEIIEEALYQKNSILEELSVSEAKLKEIVATKDKFFSIIAHDLRGPFSGFLVLSDLMAKEADELSIKDIKKMAEAINQSANSVFKLIENLLQWSATQTGSIKFNSEELDIYELAFDTTYSLKQMASNKNIVYIQNILPDTFVNCDRNMITAVFRNLVSNAIKFTQEGGNVEIGSIKSKLSDDLKSSDNSSEIHIYIKDSGVGMKKEIIEKLFKIDENVTTTGTNNEKGTGLGLILCKEFVERHGGNIWVESELGKGSTFWFSLPMK